MLTDHQSLLTPSPVPTVCRLAGLLFFLDFLTLEDGTDNVAPQVKDYHTTMHNIPKEHRSHQHHGGSLRALHVFILLI
jgi:hypothetical protein